MATKKDLVEAYSFSRRRLVTAFVSGAPGGREVEPARPGRTIVGGLALAVLLAAGAAIAGVFAPRTPDDWTQEGLIISTDTGAAYVITGDSADVVLRPVINSTSAKLILGADAEPRLISQDTIDSEQIGDDIGILGAPASLPTSSLLVDDGWTACTDDGRGIRVRIASEPDAVAASGKAVAVRSDGKFYVIARAAQADDDEPGAYVYPLPPQVAPEIDQTDNLLSALHLSGTDEIPEVPQEWLSLFPTGGALDWSSFQLERWDKAPKATLSGQAADAVVGDLLTVESTPDEAWLVTDSGPVPLDAFATAVYRNIVLPDGKLARDITVDAAPSVGHGDEVLRDAHWPKSEVGELAGAPCAQLSAAHGESPSAQLVSPGDVSGVGDVDSDEKVQVVDPGRGAYVLSGDWTDTARGLPFVIDSKGRANPLVGRDTAELLGYLDYPVSVVPDSWIKLFGCGVNLSQDAALLPPTEDSKKSCEDE